MQTSSDAAGGAGETKRKSADEIINEVMSDSILRPSSDGNTQATTLPLAAERPSPIPATAPDALAAGGARPLGGSQPEIQAVDAAAVPSGAAAAAAAELPDSGPLAVSTENPVPNETQPTITATESSAELQAQSGDGTEPQAAAEDGTQGSGEAAATTSSSTHGHSKLSTSAKSDKAGKTFKRVGSELVPQVRLPKWQLEETADRLSKPKERVKTSNVRAKAVQLKYEYDKALRGGKGGYKETLVPAKKVTDQEKQDYMLSLAERCSESKLKMKEALKEKYLGPLNPSVKKIAAGEEMDQHLAKIDKLFHGQGVTS